MEVVFVDELTSDEEVGIRIKAPTKGGSAFFNYKEYHSIVLLAVVDAHCRFTAIDIGCYTMEEDAGIFL